jgi:hypothetical protein
VVIEVALVAAVMLGAKAAPTLGRDTMFGDDRREIRARPVQVVVLAVVAQAAEDQAEADEAVHHASSASA